VKSTIFSLIALLCFSPVASAQGVVHESPIKVRSYRPGEQLFWVWRERCAADVLLVKLTDGRVIVEVPEGSAATLHFQPSMCEEQSIMTCGPGIFVITKCVPGLVRVESFHIPQRGTVEEIQPIPRVEEAPLPPLEIPLIPQEPAEPAIFEAPVGALSKYRI
jgi:hypothetical protein